METFISIVAAVVAVMLVAFTIVYNVIKRKKGKTCCGDCAKCRGCADALPKDKP